MVEVTPGEGEIIGDSADRRVELLAELDEVHATLSRFGPGRDGADRHVHRAHADVPSSTTNTVTVPPMVIHGFGNTSDADVWYVNLHIPGLGFNDYMRGLRDGVRVDFDQFDPPEDGAGVRPASELVVASGRATVDGLDIILGDDGVLEVGDQLVVNPRPD